VIARELPEAPRELLEAPKRLPEDAQNSSKSIPEQIARIVVKRVSRIDPILGLFLGPKMVPKSVFFDSFFGTRF